MRQFLLGGLLCCIALTSTTQVQAVEPLDVIKKAIEANGGKKNLTKYRAMTAKGKGVVNTQGMELKYDATWKFHYPGRMRVDIEADAGGMNITVVQVYNGKEGWQKIAGMGTMPLSKDQITALQNQMRVEMAATLVPLLDSKTYKISVVGESDVKGKKTIGLNVTAKDGLDVIFYFDKKTHMMVKQEYQTKSEDGRDVLQSVFLTGYKKQQGMAVPTKLEVLQDGKKFVTAEFSEIEMLEKIDASTFVKP